MVRIRLPPAESLRTIGSSAAEHRGFCRRSTIEPGSSTARSVKLGMTAI